MKTLFTGISHRGDLTEALQNALKQASKEFHEDSAWTLQRTGGKGLELGGPLSVTIRIGGDKGEDANPRGTK
jgi:hypothetical protein